MQPTNPMKNPSPKKSKIQIPARYQQFAKSYPTVMQAVEALGEAAQSAGPLDGKTRALVKLAIALGALREGAVHSHTRRALHRRRASARGSPGHHDHWFSQYHGSNVVG
jgi:alkylhydroperoxidase/carboxymuconolactone decarboxylase family protein YurZ